MASKDKIFLDTDVALDHLADRQPFAEYAHRLFALSEIGELTVCVSSLSFGNLYYILRKREGTRGCTGPAWQVEAAGARLRRDRS